MLRRLTLLALLALFPLLAAADVVNVWIAVSDTAKDRVVEFLTWNPGAIDPETGEPVGEYAGPITQDEGRLFRFMQDRASRIGLYKSPTIQARTYTLFSVDFDADSVPVQRVRDTIDGLVTKYPNQIAVMGAWRFDNGRQVGATYDENGTKTADGLYPIHAQLWRFMPDSVGATSNADLTDVNILYGQTPRDFQ